MNRRKFLQNAAAFPFVARSTVLGANDRIDIGFVGLGGLGEHLVEPGERRSAVVVHTHMGRPIENRPG